MATFKNKSFNCICKIISIEVSPVCCLPSLTRYSSLISLWSHFFFFLPSPSRLSFLPFDVVNSSLFVFLCFFVSFLVYFYVSRCLFLLSFLFLFCLSLIFFRFSFLSSFPSFTFRSSLIFSYLYPHPHPLFPILYSLFSCISPILILLLFIPHFFSFLFSFSYLFLIVSHFSHSPPLILLLFVVSFLPFSHSPFVLPFTSHFYPHSLSSTSSSFFSLSLTPILTQTVPL